MVQYVELVFNRNASGLEIAKGSDDVTVLHVTGRIVVTANHENPGMPAARRVDKEMKHAVIVVIAGQEKQRLQNGVQQVFRVISPAQAHTDWDDH
jgi:hypothetical protein